MLLRSLLSIFAAAALAAQSQAPKFEVASVKPSPPMPNDLAGGFAQLNNSGVKVDPSRASFVRMTLRDLISRAYRVQSFQISGPDWIKTAQFDIFAKLPEGSSTDAVPEMLQALLTDRFKLTLQFSSKDFSVYVLSSAPGGAKLPPKPADYEPKSKSDTFPQTMDSFASLLASATGRPVLNRTGMEGQFLLPSKFIQAALTRALLQRLSERSGASPEWREQIQEQMRAPSESDMLRDLRALGLALEPGTPSIAFLTVEHVEKTPTEN